MMDKSYRNENRAPVYSTPVMRTNRERGLIRTDSEEGKMTSDTEDQSKQSRGRCGVDDKPVESTRESTSLNDEEEDEGELFAKSLNAIILQYLESCGLTETYTTFYDECKGSGMLIPSHFSSEIERGISLQDVETLLTHFDQENGEALLELWELLTGLVDVGQNYKEVEKITFYIQVYIALIPFRQNMSEGRKNSSMKTLREYFETKSEACTIDNEMSSLFALPFVPDPVTHPVFGDLFKVAWVKKLRSRIKNLARALCSPNKLVTRDSTDLAKMFRACSNAIPHEIESSDGKKICILSNTEVVEFTSGITLRPTSKNESSKDEFSPSQFFQRMNDLILENERYKREESKYEKQCAQLLNVSIMLANSLEDAAQGKEVNMEKLKHEIDSILPLGLASMKTNSGDNKPCQRASSGNTSYDSDASNVNQGRLDSDNEDVKRRKHKKHEKDDIATDSN